MTGDGTMSSIAEPSIAPLNVLKVGMVTALALFVLWRTDPVVSKPLAKAVGPAVIAIRKACDADEWPR
jgi:hypothetical protein